MNIQLLARTPPWEWPKHAAQFLKNTLRNGADSERLIAAELSSEIVVMDDEMASILLEIACNSESDELRAQCAIALGPVLEHVGMEDLNGPSWEVDDKPPISWDTYCEIRSTLYQIYIDESVPKLVRRRALEAAVRSTTGLEANGKDWHTAAIRTAYASSDEEWRLTAVFAMRFVRGFDRDILESLNSENEDIHYEAVRAAGAFAVAAAWEHIQALLVAKDTPKPLLLAAIEAAPYVNPEEAGPAVVNFSGSADEEIADAALAAMYEVDGMNSFEDDEKEDF